MRLAVFSFTLSNVPGSLLRNGVVLWKGAYSRFFAKRHGKQSAWLMAVVSRVDGNIPALWSLKRETPATTLLGV